MQSRILLRHATLPILVVRYADTSLGVHAIRVLLFVVFFAGMQHQLFTKQQQESADPNNFSRILEAKDTVARAWLLLYEKTT